MKKLLFLFLMFYVQLGRSQSPYFPPLIGNGWDTLTPSTLNWCPDKIDSLYDFLEAENTKAFIVLKDGHIVLEKYFGSFRHDSLWYWASAGKSLRAFQVGQAQEEGFLSVHDKTSDYLGTDWTNAPPAKEDSITIWHQLTMTTGLDDGVPDVDCTNDSCLLYLASAGSRWAYHNAPYTLLKDVMESATSMNLNTYTNSRMLSKTGMNGLWIQLGYNNVFFSNARSMARFGLLVQNNGIWNTDTLLHDTAYFRQMVNTSQNLNKSYGYLWWLGGKASYMVPGLQFVFNGSFAPDAPADMIAGLGKNGQVVSLSPSQGLVMVRMGEAPNGSITAVPTIFCNTLWQKINDLICNPISEEEELSILTPEVYPNPARQLINLKLPYSYRHFIVQIHNQEGKLVFQTHDSPVLDISPLPQGVYFIHVVSDAGVWQKKLLKS